MMDKIMPWRASSSGEAGSAPGLEDAPADFRLGGNSTAVMSDYHICRYDALLGVLVCVGDDAKVLVLGRDGTRELLPVRQGTHWLDCFVYAGTTTFLMLAPEAMLCMDYSVQHDDSTLAYSGQPGTQFTCLHVPPGLTCGAVGRKDGKVSYFRLQPPQGNPQGRPCIAWTTVEVDALKMCQPYCRGAAVVPDPNADRDGKFFSIGSVLAIDSYPDNPNAFIGVVAGVPGVVKWYLDENRVSCFFDAQTLASQPDGLLATCKVTPGGVYVAASTMHSSKVLLWNESKKKRDKVCELYWAIDLSDAMSTSDARLLSGADSFWFNEYRVGIHMARTMEDGFRSTNDKHSQMYLLVHGQRDILEIVIRLDDRQVVRKEQIIAHLNAYTATAGVDAAKTRTTAAGGDGGRGRSAADDYFKLFHVEPCVLSNYWTSALTDVDLEALFITSAGGLRPILAKRNRQTGGIDSIQELRELTAKTAWYPRAMLLRLPASQIQELALQVKQTPITSTWEKLLRGGDVLLAHALPSSPVAGAETSTTSASSTAEKQLWRQAVVATVADAGQAVYLSPKSNEAFSVNPRAVQNCTPWTTTVAIGQDPEGLVLEAALPSLDASLFPSEVILRVSVTESVLTVMKTDIRRSSCKLVLDLARASLGLEGAGTPGTRMVRKAILVDARLEPSRVTSKTTIYKDGKSLLLLLEDSSMALVDLSGAKTDDGQPYFILVPAGLLPVGATAISVDAFWAPAVTAAGGDTLCLACLFGEGKGFLLWNLSSMRMITYMHAPYAAEATRLCVADAVAAPLPNLSGEITQFDVALSFNAVTANAAVAAGEHGEIVFQDALGATVLVLSLGSGLVQGDEGWCVRPVSTGGAAVAWAPIGSAQALSGGIVFKCRVDSGTLEWAASSVGDSGTAALASGSQTLTGTASNVKASWDLGKAELSYDTPDGDMCAYVLNAPSTASAVAGAAAASTPTLAFISPTEMNLVDVGPFLRAAAAAAQAGKGGTVGMGSAVNVQPAVCRLDPSRRWEHISMYKGRGAVLVVTSDTNGWRWVNILDNRTARPRMQPYATLDFAGEKNIQVLSLEVDNILHLYFLGEANGTLGHLFIEANLGACKESGILSRRCFVGRQFQPTPPTFRGYGRFLPPAPTLKQETGFFKRLMTLPWEDVALKMESETLRNVAQGEQLQRPTATAATTVAVASPKVPSSSAASSPVSSNASPTQTSPTTAAAARAAKEKQELLQGSRPPNAPPAQSAAASGTSAAKQGSEQEQEQPAPGSRYAQLKAVAESQNVSLTEARRMMSENMRKLQERGDKLNQMQNKSEELSQQATTFEELCRQLKEKQRSSWL